MTQEQIELYDVWWDAQRTYLALHSQGKHCPQDKLLEAWEKSKQSRKAYERCRTGDKVDESMVLAIVFSSMIAAALMAVIFIWTQP